MYESPFSGVLEKIPHPRRWEIVRLARNHGMTTEEFVKAALHAAVDNQEEFLLRIQERMRACETPPKEE